MERAMTIEKSSNYIYTDIGFNIENLKFEEVKGLPLVNTQIINHNDFYSPYSNPLHSSFWHVKTGDHILTYHIYGDLRLNANTSLFSDDPISYRHIPTSIHNSSLISEIEIFRYGDSFASINFYESKNYGDIINFNLNDIISLSDNVVFYNTGYTNINLPDGNNTFLFWGGDKFIESSNGMDSIINLSWDFDSEHNWGNVNGDIHIVYSNFSNFSLGNYFLSNIDFIKDNVLFEQPQHYILGYHTEYISGFTKGSTIDFSRVENLNFINKNSFSGNGSPEVRLHNNTATGQSFWLEFDESGNGYIDHAIKIYTFIEGFNRIQETYPGSLLLTFGENYQDFDTSVLKIDPINGDFVEQAGGNQVFTGTVFIGRNDGVDRLLRVEGATVTLFEDHVSVRGGHVYGMGNNDFVRAIGDFDIAYADGRASNVNFSYVHPLAGLDLFIKGFRIQPDRTVMDVGLDFPLQLTGLSIGPTDIGLGLLTLDAEGNISFGADVKVNLPDIDYSFMEMFSVNASGQKIGYNALEDTIKYEGLLKFGFPVKGADATVTANLQDPYYAGIVDGSAQFVGKLGFDAEIPFGPFTFNNLELDINTVEQSVSASAAITLDLNARTPKLDLDVAFNFSPFELDSVGFAADELNIMIKPSIFLQKLGIKVDNLAPSNNQAVSAGGAVAFTFGPEVSLPLISGNASIVRADVDVTWESGQIRGQGTAYLLNENIVRKEGSVVLNWEKEFVSISGDISILDGTFSGTAQTRADSQFNLDSFANGSLSVPRSLPKFGGLTLGEATARFAFSNDGNFSNDYVMAWSTIDLSFSLWGLGVKANVIVGVRYNFAEGFSLVGPREINALPDSVMMVSAEGSDMQGLSMNDADMLVPMLAPASAADQSQSFFIEEGLEYSLFTLEWSNTAAARPDITIVTPDGQRITEDAFAENNIIIVPELTQDGLITIAVGPQQEGGVVASGIWTLEIEDASQIGETTIAAFNPPVPSAQIDIDGVSLEDDSVIIEYSAQATASFADIALYYAKDDSFENLTPISGSFEMGSNSFTWEPTDLDGGTYYITAMIIPDDGAPVWSIYETPFSWAGEVETTSVFRFYNEATRVHFLTTSEEERDLIIAEMPTFNYEGVAFSTSAPSEDSLSVHRFFNADTRAHFYTADDDERDMILETWPSFQYEGVAFNAFAEAADDRREVHRFYNTETNTHFYTADDDERDTVINTLPTFNYEGVSYYVDAW